MRNRALHDALREFALETAAHLTHELERGAEIPFDVVEEPGGTHASGGASCTYAGSVVTVSGLPGPAASKRRARIPIVSPSESSQTTVPVPAPSRESAGQRGGSLPPWMKNGATPSNKGGLSAPPAGRYAAITLRAGSTQARAKSPRSFIASRSVVGNVSGTGGRPCRGPKAPPWVRMTSHDGAKVMAASPESLRAA